MADEPPIGKGTTTLDWLRLKYPWLGEMLDRLESELSEARAALARAEGVNAGFLAQQESLAYQAGRIDADRLAEAAEAACRSHEEAIGVLREALEEIKSCRDEFASRYVRGLAHNALANPVPAQVERERRAEREVVRAAVAYRKAVDTGTFTNEDRKLYDAVEAIAALHASPPYDT